MGCGRVLVLLTAAGLVGVGAAGCGSTTVADALRSAAVDANLQASDFPSNWTNAAQMPSNGAGTKPAYARCLHISLAALDRRPWVRVASRAFSAPRVAGAPGLVAFSDISYQRTTAIARQGFARVAGNPRNPVCSANQARTLGLTLRPGTSNVRVLAQAMDIHQLGDQSVALQIRIATSIESSGQPVTTVNVYTDLVTIRNGRATVVLGASDVSTPPPKTFVTRLARLLLHRLRHT